MAIPQSEVEAGGERGRTALDTHIKGSDYDNLDILPADFSYRHMDRVLDEAKKPTGGIKRSLKSLAGDYDCIFLDCPPGVSLLSENIFRAADGLLAPVIPTTLSQRALRQLIRFLRDQRYKKPQLMPFLSMVDRRKKLHQELLASLLRDNPGMLRTSIPNSGDVEKMGVYRKPLAEFAPRGAPARAYRALWREIGERLSQPRR